MLKYLLEAVSLSSINLTLRKVNSICLIVSGIKSAVGNIHVKFRINRGKQKLQRQNFSAKQNKYRETV